MRDIETLEPLVNLDLKTADFKMMELNMLYYQINDQIVDGQKGITRCKVELDLPNIVPISVDAFLSDKASLKKNNP